MLDNSKKLYFSQLKKAKCPHCGMKTEVYSFGEYIRGRFNKIEECCRECFQVTLGNEVCRWMQAHKRNVEFIFKYGPTPDWIETRMRESLMEYVSRVCMENDWKPIELYPSNWFQVLIETKSLLEIDGKYMTI